jgi:putative transcriptional regulator
VTLTRLWYNVVSEQYRSLHKKDKSMNQTQNKKARIDVASKVKTMRESKGMTQGVLADFAGIDRKTINRIENGHFSPSMDTFFRICYALDTRPSEMVSGIKV